MTHFEKIYFRKEAALLAVLDIPETVQAAWKKHWSGDFLGALKEYDKVLFNELPTRLRQLAEADRILLKVKTGDPFPPELLEKTFLSQRFLKIQRGALSARIVLEYSQFIWAFFQDHQSAWPALYRMFILSLLHKSRGLTRLSLFLIGHLMAIRGRYHIGFFIAKVNYNSLINSLRTRHPADMFSYQLALAAFPYTYIVADKLSSAIEKTIMNGEAHLRGEPFYQSIFQVSVLYAHAYTGDIVRTEIYSDRLKQHHKEGNLLRYQPVSKMMVLLPFALRGYAHLASVQFYSCLAEHQENLSDALINSQFYRAGAVFALYLGQKTLAKDLIEKASAARSLTHSFRAWELFDERVRRIVLQQEPFDPKKNRLLFIPDQPNPPSFSTFFIELVQVLSETMVRDNKWFSRRIVEMLCSHLEWHHIEISTSLNDESFLHPIIKLSDQYIAFIGLPESRKGYIRELLSAISPIIRTFTTAEEELRQAREVEKDTAIAKISIQVAHDIRSPLSALDKILYDVDQINDEKRQMIRRAINRIGDIANDLLEKNRVLKNGSSKSEKKIDSADLLLSPLIDSVVTEKRLQFRQRINVSIEFSVAKDSYGQFAHIRPADFKRVLSNLINNAVEAIPDGGKVSVSLHGHSQFTEIQIRDTGPGISQSVLKKIGIRGFSHEKQNGNGLGVSHAKEIMQTFSGSLDISSDVNAGPNQGTLVTLRFPRTTTPAWFVGSLELSPSMDIVVVDDDTLVYQEWKSKFAYLQLSRFDIQLSNFSSPNELVGWVNSRPRNNSTMYLIDYEFFGTDIVGLDVIEALGIESRSILVSSYYEERGVLEQCCKLGVRMIPKSMLSFVPVSIRSNGPGP